MLPRLEKNVSDARNGDDGVHTGTPRSHDDANDALYSVALFIIFLPSPAQY